MTELAAMIDARCFCDRCEERTRNIYRMVGSCSNCHGGPFLILYRAGDKVYDQDCPECGNDYSVRSYSQRRATSDEIPAAVKA